MLVLSRQRDEAIIIDDEIELTVVDIRGDKVRLGITAPAHIAVHRKEIYDAIKRENEQAARFGEGDLGSFPRQVKTRRPVTRSPAPATRLAGRTPSSKRESA